MLRDDEKGGLRALAGDLGVSRSVDSSAYAHTNVGATSCKAPEVLFARHGDVLKYKPQPVDVWGAGVLVYQMVIGETPLPKTFREDPEETLSTSTPEGQEHALPGARPGMQVTSVDQLEPMQESPDRPLDTPSGLRQVPHTGNASELTEIEEQILMLQARKAALLHPAVGLSLQVAAHSQMQITREEEYASARPTTCIPSREALCKLIPQLDVEKGVVYPCLSSIRQISQHVAMDVIKIAAEEGHLSNVKLRVLWKTAMRPCLTAWMLTCIKACTTLCSDCPQEC
ncbi:TPA: hypothetical protein ACH3X3_004682 [Trebouxia sp. C0006]